MECDGELQHVCVGAMPDLPLSPYSSFRERILRNGVRPTTLVLSNIVAKRNAPPAKPIGGGKCKQCMLRRSFVIN